MDGHQINEERSLRLHGAVADKLLSDPVVLAKARQRVERWIVDGSVHPRYADAWRRLLSMSPEEISQRLVDRGETMCALRQCSPFAGALDPRERWRILRQAREAQSAPTPQPLVAAEGGGEKLSAVHEPAQRRH